MRDNFENTVALFFLFLMESALQPSPSVDPLLELSKDPSLYVICGVTNEILKFGNGDLGDQETWDTNVVRLGCIQHIREFRQIMHGSSADRPMPQITEPDAEGNGDIKQVQPDNGPRNGDGIVTRKTVVVS